jgi:hypothetical protein
MAITIGVRFICFVILLLFLATISYFLTCHHQRTQIIRHVPELSQHGRIVEIARSWIASAAPIGRWCQPQAS